MRVLFFEGGGGGKGVVVGGASLEVYLSWTWLSKIQVLVQRTCFFQIKMLRLFRILAKKGIDLDEGYCHRHPCPPQTKKKPEKTKKNRLVRELLGDEEGSMNLDDSTGQTPSAILSGMTYLQDADDHHHPSESLAIQGIFIIHVKRLPSI